MTYFIDTNIFIRVLVVDTGSEKMFKDSVVLLASARSKKVKMITSPLVLAEMAWVLKSVYGFDRKDVGKAIGGIVKLPNLSIVEIGFEYLLAVKMYSSKSVKFIDALIASNKNLQEKKWIVVSFDKDFDKLGVKRMEPAEIMLK